MGIDPRKTRARWEESLRMIPRIWEDGLFSGEGKFWNVPPRDVRPKPFQKPHPRIWVAALQPATYELAAELGIGVMALSVASPSYLAPHIKEYKERVRHAKPVGKFINDQWLSSTMASCDWDNQAARELAAKSLRTFFGPDRPYLKDQTHLYEQLVESWGGVPGSSAGQLRPLPQDRGDRRAPPRSTSRAGRARSPPRCGIRSTPTRSSSAASWWPAIPRAVCAASPSTRRPAWTSSSSSWPPRPSAREGDVVHRDVRQARHPPAEEIDQGEVTMTTAGRGKLEFEFFDSFGPLR